MGACVSLLIWWSSSYKQREEKRAKCPLLAKAAAESIEKTGSNCSVAAALCWSSEIRLFQKVFVNSLSLGMEGFCSRLLLRVGLLNHSLQDGSQEPPVHPLGPSASGRWPSLKGIQWYVEQIVYTNFSLPALVTTQKATSSQSCHSCAQRRWSDLVGENEWLPAAGLGIVECTRRIASG